MAACLSYCCLFSRLLVTSSVRLLSGTAVAVKVLESVHEIIEEIEEEYLVLRDLGRHPNLPLFFGLFMHRSPRSVDQLWIVMEVSGLCQAECLDGAVVRTSDFRSSRRGFDSRPGRNQVT